MSIADDLPSPVPAGYAPRPVHGRVPNPITLFDAARLIARDPAGRGASHPEVLAGVIGEFWRGEFERQRRSLVFTLEPPRIRARSEPGQTMADVITTVPPPGAWVEDTGRVYDDKADCILQVRRRRMAWTRWEVLAALTSTGNFPDSYTPRFSALEAADDRLLTQIDAATGRFVATSGDPPRFSPDQIPQKERNAAYQLLAEAPLQDWSEHARALIWDRLCITLQDLADWVDARGERRPEFLLGVKPDPEPAKKSAPATPADRQSTETAAAAEQQKAVDAEIDEWLTQIASRPWSAAKKEHLIQAKKRWPGVSEARVKRRWSAVMENSPLARGGRRR